MADNKVKVSALSAIPDREIDDQDMLLVTDKNNDGLFSRRMSMGQLRQYVSNMTLSSDAFQLKVEDIAKEQYTTLSGVLSSNGIDTLAGVDEQYFRPTMKEFDANPVRTDLSVIKLSAEDYNQLVIDDVVLSNALYIVENNQINAYGQQIKNISAGTDPDDAVSLRQLQSALDGILSRLSALEQAVQQLNS